VQVLRINLDGRRKQVQFSPRVWKRCSVTGVCVPNSGSSACSSGDAMKSFVSERRSRGACRRICRPSIFACRFPSRSSAARDVVGVARHDLQEALIGTQTSSLMPRAYGRRIESEPCARSPSAHSIARSSASCSRCRRACNPQRTVEVTPTAVRDAMTAARESPRCASRTDARAAAPGRSRSQVGARRR